MDAAKCARRPVLTTVVSVRGSSWTGSEALAASLGGRNEHADADRDARDDAHQQVARGFVAGHAAQHRPAGAKQQNREREHDHAPGEEASALVVALRELGGQCDVGDLKEAECGRGGNECHEYPRRRGPWPDRRWHRESECKQHRQCQRADEHEPAASAARAQLTIADRADDGVDDDIPDLGRRHDHARQQGGHAERVRQVVRQHQPGQGREAAGAE